MAIKIGDINNEEGDARIGNEINDSMVESKSLDIEVGDINNAAGKLDVGNKLTSVSARWKWIGIVLAIGTTIASILGYYYGRTGQIEIDPVLIDSVLQTF